MVAPGAGHLLRYSKVSWLKRDTLLFNVSIGCKADEPQYTYEHSEGFTPFPTFPLGLVFKGDTQEVTDFTSQQGTLTIPGVPTLHSKSLVDGERAIHFIKPLPVTSDDHEFEIRENVLGAFDKGKAGTVLQTEIKIADVTSHEVYTRIVGSWFFVGQGGWYGPRGSKSASYPPPNRSPDGTMNMHVHEESAHLYRLNGDYNPLHAFVYQWVIPFRHLRDTLIPLSTSFRTPEQGERMGFGGIILHGVYAYNCVAHDLLRELGSGAASNIKEFQAKFAGVVKPNDDLETDYWRMGTSFGDWEEIRFVTKVVSRAGVICLSDGRALIKTAVRNRETKI